MPYDASTGGTGPCADHCYDDLTNCGETAVDCGGECRACREPALDVGVYPQGARFPLVLIGFEESAMAEAVACSWNVAHTYTSIPTDLTFMEECAQGGMLSLTRLASAEGSEDSPLPESQVADAVSARAATGWAAWWDLPEEMRWWIPSEMEVVTSYSSWTRFYDPGQRPNLMYIPSHYSTSSVEPYVPFLDVIPASCYTKYAGQPHAWLRWRMESTVQAIANSGAETGRDYLAGQKTPVAYLELYTGSLGMTPEGSYHDFWQAIVSGARGLLVYAHAYRDDSPNLFSCWAQLCEAARRLTGPEDLEDALLYGAKQDGITIQVLSGPERTPAFDTADAQTIDFPTIDSLAVVLGEELFLIAVSSAEADATARITGLPERPTADVLFEDRTVPVVDGQLEDTFAPLAVHVYRVRR